jgi:hypothetical protein
VKELWSIDINYLDFSSFLFSTRCSNGVDVTGERRRAGDRDGQLDGHSQLSDRVPGRQLPCTLHHSLGEGHEEGEPASTFFSNSLLSFSPALKLAKRNNPQVYTFLDNF